MLNSHSMTALVVVAITYLLFVFLGNSLNPFKSPKGRQRFRWKFARIVALIFFFCALAVLFLRIEWQLSVVEASALLAAWCAVLCIFPAVSYYRNVKAYKRKRVKENTAEPDLASIPNKHAQTATVQNATVQNAIENPVEGLPASSVAELEFPDNLNGVSVRAEEFFDGHESNNADLGSSVLVDKEHTLESLVEPEVDDFDPLDHTIAEADFHIAEFSPSEEYDVATPIIDNNTDSPLLLDDIADNDNQLDDIKDDSAKPISAIDEEANKSKTLLLEKVLMQEAKIRKITESNESLVQAREALVDEVAELKFEVKKRGTIARKTIAQRNEALAMKDRALAIATMEQKKRKLTEVRARKALIKMRASLQMLSDQSARQ